MKTTMRLRTLTILIPLLAATVAAAAGPDSSASFDDLIRQGRAALLAADPARAESAYNQACPADRVSTYPVAKEATCENALASVDEVRGNLDRAVQRYVHAVAVAEQAGPAYEPLYCARLIGLGEFYHHHGQDSEAESSLLRAVSVARSLTGIKPELLSAALIRLGGFYSDSSRPERARAPLTEGLALFSSGGERPEAAVAELAYGYDALGRIDLAAGYQREAESNLREAISLSASILGEDHPVTAVYQTNLGLALLFDRQFERAGLLFRRAQYVVESRPEPSRKELGVIYAGLSVVANSDGKTALAEDYARRSIAILSAAEQPDISAIALARVTLAGAYLRAHNTAEAETILPGTVELLRAANPNSNSLAASIELLGELRLQQRNWQAAESLYREAIGIYERGGPASGNPVVVPLLRALADVLKKDGGSKAEARALESRARDIARSATSGTATARTALQVTPGV
jgi:tetratricopeptide (TPR) repeat protein